MQELVDRGAFETIANSAQRMGRLIEQLAERDRRERRQRVNVVDIIDAAIRRTLDRTPGPSRDALEGDFFVMADRDRLFSIFHHLLRNAQEACGEYDSIRVSFEHRDGALQIDIADSGRGMDETFVRSRLFRPFDSTKGVNGMGIGAFQAREYVRELAGHMRVRSAPGQGTVISISLPLAAGRDDA